MTQVHFKEAAASFISAISISTEPAAKRRAIGARRRGRRQLLRKSIKRSSAVATSAGYGGGDTVLSSQLHFSWAPENARNRNAVICASGT